MASVRLFGLTGGIASGKSTVARRFRERRVPVLDADVIAREIVARGTDGLAALVDAFGPSIVGADGELDRKALAAIAFADPAARGKLNAITHPRIAMATQTATARLAEQGEPVACYEAALLVENGVADMFRPLVVVAADEPTQLARAMARDAASEADVRARLAAQMPLAQKTAKADFVITNDGSQAQLIARADEVLDAVLAQLGVDLGRYRA